MQKIKSVALAFLAFVLFTTQSVMAQSPITVSSIKTSDTLSMPTQQTNDTTRTLSVVIVSQQN